MLENFYHTQCNLNRIAKNYLAEFIIEASQKFTDGNYSKNYVYAVLRCMIRFGNWLQKRNVPYNQIDISEVDSFMAYLYTLNTSRRRSLHRGALKLLLSAVKRKYPVDNPIQIEIERYSNYLRNVRGLLESTIINHQNHLREFLTNIFLNQQIRICRLKPTIIRTYIENLPITKANSKRKGVCSTLSCYFRFLEIEGKETNHLVSAIPPIPVGRRSIIPTILSENELNKFLQSINRNTAIGKRNYAVVACLSDLAMRIGDVSRISLDDIDWKQGTIRVSNQKRATPFILPLPKRVGEAISDYILNGRPLSDYRNLFLHHSRHYLGIPATYISLKAAIKRLWAKSGLPDRYSGTHIFRRSTATALKCRGMPLKIISDLLGHASIESTALYAQVDLPSLRSVSQPWPLKRGAG